VLLDLIRSRISSSPARMAKKDNCVSRILCGCDNLQRFPCIFGVRPKWQYYIAATGHYYGRRPAGSVLQFGDRPMHQVHASFGWNPSKSPRLDRETWGTLSTSRLN
jgi:hypothetical protein